MKTAERAGKAPERAHLLSRDDAAGRCGWLMGRPKVARRNGEIRMAGITRAIRWTAVLATILGAPAQTLPQAATDPNRIDVVCLDAGHGGKDPGNLGTGRFKTTEKHVALNVTKLVGKYIKENYPDVNVV